MTAPTTTEFLGTVPADVRAFLDDEHTPFINGKKVRPRSGEQPRATRDPGTGETIAEIHMGGAAEVEAAVAAASAAFRADSPWSRMSAYERGVILNRWADLLEEHLEELAWIESLDGGKPLAVARDFDVTYTIKHLRYYAGWPSKIEGNTIPVDYPNMMVRTERVPVGVVAGIVPWNFPLLIAMWKIAPALSTGCTMVLKPAELTSLSVLRAAELATQAGLPDGVLNVVPGPGRTIGPILTQHPDVNKVSFTGSTEVGRDIGRTAMDGVKRVTLELGGKSANIVFADADIDSAIAGAAAAIFSNAGQSCNAGSRLYIERSVFDEVVEGVSAIARELRVDHQLTPGVDMGPLISEQQLKSVAGYLESARTDGAGVAAGGRVHPDGLPGGGHFIDPTVLVDVDDTMKVVREEIFGPVVVAQPFDTLDEVAARANDSIYGLAAGVWSSNIATANRLSTSLRAGSVYVNTYGTSDAAAPFGGFGQSGIGREMGHASLEGYLETRTTWVDISS